MLERPHFKNGLKCRPIHNHGASCAVDVLLDTFYFGIYEYTKHLSSSNYDRMNSMVLGLEAVCHFRDVFKSASCDLREEMWDWCVQNLANAYSPKGRGDAEVLEGFVAFADNSNCTVKISTEASCHKCAHNISNMSSVAVVSVTSPVSVECSGHLGKSVEMQISQYARTRFLPCTVHPNADLECTILDVIWPDILIVELGIVDHLNQQSPPAQIPQCMSVGNCMYELAASVQAAPGHFYCIVRKDNQYAVIDGLMDHISYFNTFTGAVYKDNTLTEHTHSTTTNHHAIHILIFLERPATLHNAFSVTTTTGNVPVPAISTTDDSRHADASNQSGALASRCHSTLVPKSTTTTGKVSVPDSSFHHTCSLNHPVGDHLADRYINLGVGNVKVVEDSGHIFALCKEVFHHADMTSHVKKNGYKLIDQVLCKAGLAPERCFLLSGTRRHYIRKDALSTLLQSRIGNSMRKRQMMSELRKTCDVRQCVDQNYEAKLVSPQNITSNDYDKRLKRIEESAKAGGATMFTGHVSLSGGKVRYATKDMVIYLCCNDIFKICGIAKNLKHDGYAVLDKQLNKLGLIDAFLHSGNQRILIQLTSVVELLNDGLSRSCLSVVNLDRIKKELISVMQSETCLDIQKRRRMVTPKKNNLTSPITVNRSPMTMLTKKRHRTLFPVIRKNSSLKRKTAQLKSAMKNVYQCIFKNKNDFMSAFARLITHDEEVLDVEFDGGFSASCITQILKMVECKTIVRPRYANFLEQVVSETVSISVADVIHLEENFSGTRLMEQLRLKLPTILPSQREERALKKNYNSQFNAILLPQRTSTGWCVDPGRLMELLSFKYWWLPEEKHWKVYGDGRLIGGRHSCFIALSTLNNEARLHGISHQSPKEIYPVFVFYESDSRDNIEENIGFPSKLDCFIQEKQRSNNIFYLSGDEMFLESMLASEGLGPLTRNGWNIYRADGTEHKQETSPSTGMRTDLNLEIDREHPDSILSSIPTCRVVLCLLHALARSVEKFINLEVDNILSDGNKAGQRGQDSAAFVEEKIQNLQNNINKRGVRGGQFRVNFNSKGTPEPVKLNKTHAIVIISSPPAGNEKDFPPVLTQVLNSQNILVNPIPDAVKNKLSLENTYSEYELVKCIWDHFSKMITIIQKDPEPELLAGRQEESIAVDDYSFWRYDIEDRELYTYHADSFYHLYVWRYTYKALTPYMIKLIDIVPIFMRTLPFPIARFESEGGENLNNEHGRFYYQHTTRHGGKEKPDPLLSLLKNMFTRLAHTIGHGETPMDREAKSLFNTYCRRHEAAAIIQRSFRSFVGATHQNVSQPTVAVVTTVCKPAQIFSGFIFVLCGTVPKHGQKKYTQAEFKALIRENGGRVRTKLPGDGKGVSTKRYTVVASPNMIKHTKVVGPIRQAARKGFDVLNYAFVTESIDNGKLADTAFHKLDVTKLLSTVTKSVSLQERHFSKSVSMLTQLKKQRKKRQRKVIPSVMKKPVRSAALHYVLKKKRELQEGKHVTFWQSHKNLISLFGEWRTLPPSEKAKAKDEWLRDSEKS